MKKQYNTPTLTVYGNVEEITQFFGRSTTVKDFLFFPGNNTPINTNNASTFGSVDGVFNPDVPSITPRK